MATAMTMVVAVSLAGLEVIAIVVTVAVAGAVIWVGAVHASRFLALRDAAADTSASGTTHTGAQYGARFSACGMAHRGASGAAYGAANYGTGLAGAPRAYRGTGCASQGAPNHRTLFATHALANGCARSGSGTTA